jgi:hypothetical protein
MSAPYRITSRASARRGAAAAAPQGEEFNSYLDRLMKMIPAEVIALYLVGAGMIPEGQSIAIAGWAIVCLAGVVVLRVYGTADAANHKPADWTHTLICAGAFVLWIYSIGGPFTAFNVHVPWLGSLFVLAYTFFIPLVYKGPGE